MIMEKRPDPGKITVGQSVMVCRGYNDRRGRSFGGRYIPAVVTKVGRVWVDIACEDDYSPRQWRMRMDTQSEQSGYTGRDGSFLTMEQYEWEKDHDWAISVIKSHGLEVNRLSPWLYRKIELARILSAIDVWDDRETQG
jgi:hypothetical protein